MKRLLITGLLLGLTGCLNSNSPTEPSPSEIKDCPSGYSKSWDEANQKYVCVPCGQVVTLRDGTKMIVFCN